ncbi:MAG: endolytic transglycosylase MltG [Candidatus Harrisonbacteria bacterium]|nr:endolytic transglycosylase MltG [Candidatus Harrisonbacteria bacterium]
MSKLFFIFWSLISLNIALFFFLLSPASSNSQHRSVEIRGGTGFWDISRSLYEKGIIRSPRAFVIYGIISGSAHQLKPGNYSLSSGSTTPSIIRALVVGPEIDKQIIFPEGITLKDVDEALSQDKFLSPGSLARHSFKELTTEYEFLKDANSLEGFLFPDTYRFFIGGETREIVEKILDNFKKKAWPVFQGCKVKSVKCREFSLSEILIIASLLEKEAPEFKDRQIIAGIIYKRLKLGIPLQVDATITYAKCGGAFLTCQDPKVYRKDLEFQSKYNTYLYYGLPPGPIGNPGLEAVRAAIDPIVSEYLYYLSDPKTKKTIFSKDLDEHNYNRAKYLGA